MTEGQVRGVIDIIWLIHALSSFYVILLMWMFVPLQKQT